MNLQAPVDVHIPHCPQSPLCISNSSTEVKRGAFLKVLGGWEGWIGVRDWHMHTEVYGMIGQRGPL